jgi:hypothetical protein
MTKKTLNEAKKETFLDTPEWAAIVNNVKGVMLSNGTMSTLIDFERVLAEADIFAFKNWGLGELVDGPIIRRYDVTCTFLWPTGVMPDPRGAKRLLPLGCNVKFRKTSIKVPIQIKEPADFKPGTHYPKLIDRKVWLVNICIPKDLMNDIREGSIDLAGQTIDLEDLDDAYAKDYDTEGMKDDQTDNGQDQQNFGGGLGGLPPGPGAPGGFPQL